MTVRSSSRVRVRALALGALACLPSQVLAAPNPPARKAPSVRKPSATPADFASQFASAVEFYERFDYEHALEAFTKARALAKGGEQEVPVSLYLGIVHAELGNREQCLASFRTALYLQPDAALPVKVSPRVQSDFEDARKAVMRDLGITPAPVAATPAPVAPTPVAPTPVAPTPAVVATDRPVQEPAPDKGGALTTPARPAAQAVTYMPALQAERTSGPSRVLPIMLLGTSAVAGGGAAFFGVLSGRNVQAASESSYYEVRVDSLARARSQAVVANVLVATASLAALGALATFIIPGSAAPTSASTAGGVP